nr:MAG TPA: hypothetical protein [Caudoviricetes sp.]
MASFRPNAETSRLQKEIRPPIESKQKKSKEQKKEETSQPPLSKL